jgi:hypothetical protein
LYIVGMLHMVEVVVVQLSGRCTDRLRARSADAAFNLNAGSQSMLKGSVDRPFQGPELIAAKPLGLKVPTALPLPSRGSQFPLRPARPPLLDSRSRSITPTPSTGSRGTVSVNCLLQESPFVLCHNAESQMQSVGVFSRGENSSALSLDKTTF